MRKAAVLVEQSRVDLETKWRQQGPAVEPSELRALSRGVATAWKGIRDRLVALELLPEDNADRKRSVSIRNALFFDGLEFSRATFARQHAESERRLQLIDELDLEEDLSRLVGEDFVEALRAVHERFGDALGTNKKTERPAAVILTEPLRKLADAITIYAVQMLAVAYHEPEKASAVADALSPIDEFRATANRRISSGTDREDEDEDEVDDLVAEPGVPPPVATAPVVTPPVIALAPVG